MITVDIPASAEEWKNRIIKNTGMKEEDFYKMCCNIAFIEYYRKNLTKKYLKISEEE